MEKIHIVLSFHEDSTNEQRDNDFAYLFDRLDALIKETSAFSSYRIFTDEDTSTPNQP